MQPITILIAEDHMLVREAWQLFLGADSRFKVIGCCSSGEQVIEIAAKYHPDVILLDINLEGLSGIEATPVILQFSPGSKIIGLSMHTEICYVKEMMKMGAMGYMTKSSGAEELFRAIMEVHHDHKYICDEIKDELSLSITENQGRKRSAMLTAREQEIITHIKQGASSKEIGLLLNLSSKTIDMHRYNIRKKLNVKNTAALINHVNNGVRINF